MKHKAQQHEIRFDQPEDFRLIPAQDVTDWAQVARLKIEREQARKEAEERQTDLFGGGQ